MWRHIRYQGLYILSGLLGEPLAGLIVALYWGRSIADRYVAGLWLGEPFLPGQKLIFSGIYLGAILYGELHFLLGLLVRNILILLF
jgi:hypothetical protein